MFVDGNKPVEREKNFSRGETVYNCKSKVHGEVKVWFPLHEGDVGL